MRADVVELVKKMGVMDLTAAWLIASKLLAWPETEHRKTARRAARSRK